MRDDPYPEACGDDDAADEADGLLESPADEDLYPEACSDDDAAIEAALQQIAQPHHTTLGRNPARKTRRIWMWPGTHAVKKRAKLAASDSEPGSDCTVVLQKVIASLHQNVIYPQTPPRSP